MRGRPAERVSLRPAPGAQVDFEARRAARHQNLLAHDRRPQGALDEQMPAFVKPERFEIYLQSLTAVLTNSSTVPNRRNAASKAA